MHPGSPLGLMNSLSWQWMVLYFRNLSIVIRVSSHVFAASMSLNLPGFLVHLLYSEHFLGQDLQCHFLIRKVCKVFVSLKNVRIMLPSCDDISACPLPLLMRMVRNRSLYIWRAYLIWLLTPNHVFGFLTEDLLCLITRTSVSKCHVYK